MRSSTEGTAPATCGSHVAQLVIDTLKFFDGSRYDLLACCVMPNHVHVVMTIIGEQSLARILHSWKSFTGRRVKPGRFWQEEYFDRIVRDDAELERTIRYVLNNPTNAGLANWPYVWCKW